MGLVCALVAMLGLCGVCMKRAVLGRCILFVYGAIMVVVILAEIALGGTLLAWQGGAQIADIQNQETQLVTRLADKIYPDCCDAASKSIIPQPPPAGQPSCPLPDPTKYIHPGDCDSAETLRAALNRVLGDIVTPVAAATLGLAVLQFLALVLICCVASTGRKQALDAQEKARRGLTTDPSQVYLMDAAFYGDAAADSGRDPRAFSNAATTPQYVRI